MKESHTEDLLGFRNTEKEANNINTIMSHTPFKLDPSCPSVFWASGDEPYNNTRKALSNIDLSPSTNKRVLLKPNVGRNVEPETGITTHPQVVAAAIDAFRESGADVAVGELLQQVLGHVLLFLGKIIRSEKSHTDSSKQDNQKTHSYSHVSSF